MLYFFAFCDKLTSELRNIECKLLTGTLKVSDSNFLASNQLETKIFTTLWIRAVLCHHKLIQFRHYRMILFANILFKILNFDRELIYRPY